MEMKIMERLDIYFGLVKDKRKIAYVTYELKDILFMIICGILSGCKEIEQIIYLSEERLEFFKQHTQMETIPSISTVRRILEILNPKELELCMQGIIINVFGNKVKKKERQICIDGKTICSTAKEEIKNSLHIVTAMIADEYISIGQEVVGEKTNEIPIVRELIDKMDVKDTVITIDAMHCQKETIENIKRNKADYVVQLKSNHANFYEDVKAMFDKEFMDVNEKEDNYEEYSEIEKNKGRIEKRTGYVLKDVAYFTDYVAEWKGLNKIICIKRETEEKGKKTQEKSYYLSSKEASVKELMGYIRKHWQIESFHWMLDVNLGEDKNQVRNKNSQTCLNVMRKMCIGMMKQYINNHEVKRKTISGNMYKCMINTDYLSEVFQYYCSSL
jgi:predicted transposase YbfD/YdcC